MPDPCSCGDYYQCVMSAGVWVAAYHMSCPNCTCFSPDSLVCVDDPNADRDLCPETSSEDEEIIVTTGETIQNQLVDIPKNNINYNMVLKGTYLCLIITGLNDENMYV